LGGGEVGFRHEDQDFGAFGIYSELEAGEIVGAGERGRIGLDFVGDVALFEQFDQAGGLGGIKGAELMEEGFVVGHEKTVTDSTGFATVILGAVSQTGWRKTRSGFRRGEALGGQLEPTFLGAPPAAAGAAEAFADLFPKRARLGNGAGLREGEGEVVAGFLAEVGGGNFAEDGLRFGVAAQHHEGAAAEQSGGEAEHTVGLDLDEIEGRQGFGEEPGFEAIARDGGEGVRVVAKNTVEGFFGDGAGFGGLARGEEFGGEGEAKFDGVGFFEGGAEIANAPRARFPRESGATGGSAEVGQELDEQVSHAADGGRDEQYPDPPIRPAGFQDVDDQAELGEPREFGHDAEQGPITEEGVEHRGAGRGSARGFGAAGEQGFEIGLGGFLRDGGDLNFGEPGFFQEGMESALFETEPNIGVELAGLFEGVLVEIEDEELAAGAEDAERPR
jgi:hypothetical protein